MPEKKEKKKIGNNVPFSFAREFISFVLYFFPPKLLYFLMSLMLCLTHAELWIKIWNWNAGKHSHFSTFHYFQAWNSVGLCILCSSETSIIKLWGSRTTKSLVGLLYPKDSASQKYQYTLQFYSFLTLLSHQNIFIIISCKLQEKKSLKKMKLINSPTQISR